MIRVRKVDELHEANEGRLYHAGKVDATLPQLQEDPVPIQCQ